MAEQEAKTQIYEGILYKQGKLNKAWKERFFVLYSDRTLSYFKSEEAWDKGKDEISRIDLSLTRSIAPTNKKPDTSESVEKQMKKVKSRRGSLSRKWSIDFSALFSNKGGGNKDDEESDDEHDGEIAFIELVLNKQFTFEIVQAKRTYNLCTDDAIKFNKWLNKLEITTFGKKVYKGWLLKQSERNKKWDKRWFIIYDTKEMRYYDDATRAISRGMAVLSQLKKITKVDDEKAKKKFKQTNVLKLEFKQRTLLLSCSPSDDRRIWFDKICRVVGKGEYVDPIYDDYLYQYDEEKQKWKKYWFLLDKKCLLKFRDMDSCDEYCKHGYFDEKEHKKVFNRFVINKIVLQPFDPKNVQKIRPGSNLQKKLIKECIFIIHSKELGKLFFATEQSSQLNRWFKKIRSLAGDNGVRKKSKSAVSVMTDSNLGDERDSNFGENLSVGGGGTTKGGHSRRSSSRGNNDIKRSKNQDKILKMLRELEQDLGECKKDIKYVKKCWEKNNEEGDDDGDEKYNDDDDEEY